MNREEPCYHLMHMHEITTRIDRYLQRLSSPVTAEELRYGWTPQMIAKWSSWFLALRQKVVTGAPISPAAVNCAYGMGYDGIDPRSDLVEEGASICNDLAATASIRMPCRGNPEFSPGWSEAQPRVPHRAGKEP